MASLLPWIQASRPKTLLAAIVPVWLGTQLAAQLEQTWSVVLTVCTFLSALCIQIATNFFNDAIDFQKGADTEARIGPKRVTASGEITAKGVLIAAIVMVLLASGAALPLIFERGWPILAIGIPSLYFSFGYTGGPLPLAYRGLGEVFVILFFGLIAVMGTYFVQTGEVSMGALILGLQIGLYSTALIAINNLRDIETDRPVGKRTLAVRFGKSFARWEIALCCFGPLLLGVYWLSVHWLLCVLPLLAGVFAIPIVLGVFFYEPSSKYNRWLGVSALQFLMFSIFFSIALIYSS